MHINILTMVLALLFSCERDEDIRIPFGYDPEFDYLSVLRSSPAYAYEPSGGYPELTYQDSSDENLVKLKSIYKLDSVAGNGDEVKIIIDLFNRVHNMIPHDGGNSSPDPENSINILNYCQENGNMLSVAELRERLIEGKTGRIGCGHELFYQ